MNPEKKKFILLIAFNAFIVFGFFLFKYYTYSTGTEILLEVVRPVDPEDLFRGNYVTLAYAISTSDTNIVPYDYDIKPGDNIYAVMSENNLYYTIDMLSHSKPYPRNGQVCMRGIVTNVRDNQVSVEWGIESFFAPPDIAQKVDRARWGRGVDSIVSVDDNCNAVIKYLLVDGEKVRTS